MFGIESLHSPCPDSKKQIFDFEAEIPRWGSDSRVAEWMFGQGEVATNQSAKTLFVEQAKVLQTEGVMRAIIERRKRDSVILSRFDVATRVLQL